MFGKKKKKVSSKASKKVDSKKTKKVKPAKAKKAKTSKKPEKNSSAANRRIIRKDCTVKTLREKYGIDLKSSSGRRMRSDKQVGTIRKENK